MSMESKAAVSSLPPEVVDEVTRTWVDVLKTPLVCGGHFTEDDNFINISTTWSVVDPTKKETVKFLRNFTVVKSSLDWKEGKSNSEELVISGSAAIPVEGKIECNSNDGTRKAIVVEKDPGGGKEKTQILQIWNREKLLKSYDLAELDKHKSIYNSAEFGRKMAWNEKANKLAYIAEKKVPKPVPFYTSDVNLDDNQNAGSGNDSKDKKGAKGEEYALKQTWGEQLQDMYFSVIVILDTSTDKFQVIELPPEQFPADIQWVNDNSLIGTSYQITEWRLGLIYCTNRASRIFQINTDGSNLRFLSAEDRVAISPRVRPDGKYVIWQERRLDEPHNRSRNIMGCSLDLETPSPVLLYASTPPDMPIYENFPQNCWSLDGSQFFLLNPDDGVSSLFVMKFSNGKVEKRTVINTSPGIDSILWTGKSYMLISRSSILCTPYIELMEIDGNNRRAAITKSLPSIPSRPYITSKLYGQASIPSFYTGPEGAAAKSVPLIAWVHGGPHSCFLDSYMAEASLLGRLGYAMVKINYIGSLGASKRDETDDLLGKVGTLDVNDSQNIVEKAVEKFECVDPQQVGVWGGSHGGFLTCHLISQFPDFYKAGIARNPVIDLNVLIGTSDITDWSYAEPGLPFPTNWSNGFIPAVKSGDQAEKLFKASPISHVSKVKAATLICVGTEDLRVPATQGLAFYRALKAYGKTAEVRVYPDCHPLSKGPTRLDNVIHGMLWFKRFVNK